MNKLNNLTWKYFFEQKVKELVCLILGTIVLGIVWYGFAHFGRFVDLWLGDNIGMVLLCETMNTFGQYVSYGLLGIFILAVLLIAIFLAVFLSIKILYLIFYKLIWECIIMRNWKKAKSRAEKELKIKGKRK